MNNKVSPALPVASLPAKKENAGPDLEIRQTVIPKKVSARMREIKLSVRGLNFYYDKFPFSS